MSKPIKSTDPRKPAIVQALKAMTGATKITDVTEEGPTTFRGRCLGPVQKVGGRGVVYQPMTNEDGYQRITLTGIKARLTEAQIAEAFTPPIVKQPAEPEPEARYYTVKMDGNETYTEGIDDKTSPIEKLAGKAIAKVEAIRKAMPDSTWTIWIEQQRSTMDKMTGRRTTHYRTYNPETGETETTEHIH